MFNVSISYSHYIDCSKKYTSNRITPKRYGKLFEVKTIIVFVNTKNNLIIIK